MKNPKLMEAYIKMHPSPDSVSSLMAGVQKSVMAEVSNSREWQLAKTPAEKDALYNKALIAATRHIPSLGGISSQIGFGNGKGQPIVEGSL